ncbi:MAG: glutathione peroxidase [Gammaproteobacteria bacterium]|nr:glutathione peroxidase [Gammaproteobacteria bacterium]
MKSLFLIAVGLLILGPRTAVAAEVEKHAEDKALLDVVVRTLNGKQEVNLNSAYHGKVVLIVNTASKCGFTYQYDGLEKLYARYKDRGLVVLGFPSNDFANQEPGTEKQIQDFCRLTYGVQFPMFAKTRVIKPYADPLYQRLAEAAGEYPAWNFHKYLINRDGRLVASYSSSTKPESKKLVEKIESLL